MVPTTVYWGLEAAPSPLLPANSLLLVISRHWPFGPWPSPSTSNLGSKGFLLGSIPYVGAWTS
jgi:hypothetical protein